MWEQIEPTRATYRTRSVIKSGDAHRSVPCLISVDGSGGSRGWQMACRLGGEPAEAAAENVSGRFRIAPVSAKSIPQLSESYVRGNDLVLNYAQQKTDSFGLSIQITPIECSERVTIVQLTIALQTELLDSHPAIVFSADAVRGTNKRSENPAVIGPRPLPSSGGDEIYCTVILSPRDQRAAGDLSDENALRVQIFGSFLEKGVIRKSRPWVVIWRGAPPQPSEIGAVYRRLCQTPLPLTT